MIVFLEKLEKKVDSKNHGVKIQKPMICVKQWAKEGPHPKGKDNNPGDNLKIHDICQHQIFQMWIRRYTYHLLVLGTIKCIIHDLYQYIMPAVLYQFNFDI